ncbi:MAG: glycosyltransferase [Mycobacteriales bacterium]
MKVSVFSPSHNPRYLDACYDSLAAQTHADWEWLVLLNGNAKSWGPPQPDSRVRVERSTIRAKGVGAITREACERLTGDILVEFDHDDVLTPDAVSEVVRAFDENPGASLVFSDFAQINEDGSPNDVRFNADNGWVYTEAEIDGVTYLQCNALAATPHNVGYIWYAPNHIRAFRRSSYDEVGGYDAERTILDDQDLMNRLYTVGEFVHIPKLLYYQRMHGRNTQVDPKTNAEIQQLTVELYVEWIERLALAWAGRLGLECIALTTPTSVGQPELDPQFRLVTVDPSKPALDVADDRIGVIKAVDVLQRMPDRAAFLNECYRSITHAGLLLTDTPSTDGRGAFQDPSHIAFYNENSFMYLTQARLRPTIPTLTARFQASHVRTYYPSQMHEDTDIPYVKANLIAIKEGPRQGGLLLA